jgi:hypothetical protein
MSQFYPPCFGSPIPRLLWLRALLLSVGLVGLACVDPVNAAVPDADDSGLTHHHEQIKREPWSIHIIRVNRSHKEFTFVTPHAQGTVLGVSTIAEQARSLPARFGRAVAAVNGDFYERDNRLYAGDPRGLQIVNGELVSAPSTVCVWFDADDNPHLDEVKGGFQVTWPDGKKTAFGLNQQRAANQVVLYTPTYGASTRCLGGRDLILESGGQEPWLPLRAGQTYRARVREVKEAENARLETNRMILSLGPRVAELAAGLAPGATLEIATATTPDISSARAAIAGGPALVQNGVPFAARNPQQNSRNDYSERSKYERHPRSAIGWNDQFFFLITVDGRQPGLSVGMTIAELAEYLVKLGCKNGMNLDGGASASLWMKGRTVSDPCQGERPVANSLVVVEKTKGSAGNGGPNQ